MKKYILTFLLAVVALVSCKDPYEGTNFQVYEVYPAATFLENNPDKYSDWVEVLKYADLFNAVNQASESFTLFVPDNEAVQAFYREKNVSSIEELGVEYARNLAEFHVIPDTIDMEVFMNGGRLPSRTLSDDYLNISIGDGGMQTMYINNTLVSESALSVSNGYVYVLDAVMPPLVESVYQRVEASGEYALFRELLEVTSWKDSLNVIYDRVTDPNGTVRDQKRDYTVLGVTDAVYEAAGIRSIADLAARTGAASTDYTDPENALFAYAAYHVIAGNFTVLEIDTFEGRAKEKLMGTHSGMVLQVSQESDDAFYLNYDGGTDVRGRFVAEASDVPAKNGMLHRVDCWMPAWQSTTPVEVVWDLTDYPEVASYIRTNGATGQVYQTAAAAEYRTAIQTLSCYEVFQSPSGTRQTGYNPVDYFTIKTDSNWGKTTANSEPCVNGDFLVINLGYMGSIAMRSPMVILGRYKVELGVCYSTSMNFMRAMTDGSTGGAMEFSFDGGENVQRFAPIPSVPSNTLDLYPYTVFEEIEFTTTSSHQLKIVILDPAASTNSNFRIQLDYIKFIPIV